MKRLVFIGISVAAVALLSSAMTLRKHSTESAYRYVQIARGDVESTVSATGTLGAVSTVQVGTQVSGQIAKLYADFNDHVKKGQLVALLDPTLLQQAVRQAEADRDRAKADLEPKRLALDTANDMYEKKLISELDLETARSNYDMARAALQSAEANLEKEQQNLRYTSIYAPIDGVVIARNVDVGQTVAASLSAPTLFLIAEDLSRMQILVSVDESDIGRIHEGQVASFTVQAYPNRTFRGSVQQVRLQSSTNENVVDYTVVVVVANPDGTLLPGMTATVDFEVAKATDVLAVPNAALRFQPTEAMYRGATRSSADGAPGSVPAVASNRAGRRAGAGSSGGGSGGGVGAGNAQRPADMARLWYVDEHGKLAVARVHTGLSDSRVTEVSGPDVHDGMQVIAGLTSNGAANGTSSPFQPSRQQGPGPRMGGF